MSVNLFMTAKSSADYINTKLNINSYTYLDVIFLAIKQFFPAFNYLRYIGTANNEQERNVYKINGIKGAYEEVMPLDLNGLASDLVNDRSLFSDEDCNKGGLSLVKCIKAEDYSDPFYELFFDTKLVFQDIEYDENNATDYGYIARFFSISTKFSRLNACGEFNGIIRSPFIDMMSPLHFPIPELLRSELERFFTFKDDTVPYNLLTFDTKLFDSVLFEVGTSLQFCNEIYDEQIDIFEEENIDEIFLFYRPHLDEFINNIKNKRQDSLNLKSDEHNKLEREISGKSETSYLNIIQALKDELLMKGFENQDALIAYLSEQYQGYTGLSEANLRDKFSKANKIK